DRIGLVGSDQPALHGIHGLPPLQALQPGRLRTVHTSRPASRSRSARYAQVGALVGTQPTPDLNGEGTAAAEKPLPHATCRLTAQTSAIGSRIIADAPRWKDGRAGIRASPCAGCYRPSARHAGARSAPPKALKARQSFPSSMAW